MNFLSTTELTHTQMCIDKIQHDIMHGVFKPGEKLQTEKLKKRYEVGSSPIREALFHLATTGLIHFANNKGFSVATLTEPEIIDIYQTFTKIECLALEQAIDVGDEVWEGQILATLHCLALVENKKHYDYAIWSKRNDDFHQALIAGCQSPHLIRIRNELHQQFKWYTFLAFFENTASLQLNHDEHKKLAEETINRNKNKAIKLMQEHIGDPHLMVSLLKKRGLL